MHLGEFQVQGGEGAGALPEQERLCAGPAGRGEETSRAGGEWHGKTQVGILTV